VMVVQNRIIPPNIHTFSILPLFLSRQHSTDTRPTQDQDIVLPIDFASNG
jgi:hypothetical protein